MKTRRAVVPLASTPALLAHLDLCPHTLLASLLMTYLRARLCPGLLDTIVCCQHAIPNAQVTEDINLALSQREVQAQRIKDAVLDEELYEQI